MPALAAGQYEIRLDIVDTIKPEILEGMGATLNGASLELGAIKGDLPALVVIPYEAGEPPADGLWKLELSFPSVVSPAEGGSDDQRRLAIRLRSLRIVDTGALAKAAPVVEVVGPRKRRWLARR